jgi:predicted SAM-dependent methyltransferase
MKRLLLFLFSHRFLAIARWEFHFLLTRARNALTGQRGRIAKAVAGKGPLYLNLGSGPRGVDDGRWINVDGFVDRNVHFTIDFNRPLPFPDRTFAGAFCEHVLEHFDIEDGEKIAREVCRTLAPGGRFRVIVPDAEQVMRRYFDEPEALIAYRQTGSAIEAVNSFFRQRYEHQFLYDWPAMRDMLLRAGFSHVERCAYGKGGETIVLDHPKYEWESLYVEAVR